MTKTTNKNNQRLIRPCTWVFLVLILLTITTWLLGKLGVSTLEISLLVLGFAFIKALLIGDYFMGLANVTSLWRWSIIIWILLLGLLISWAFISAS